MFFVDRIIVESLRNSEIRWKEKVFRGNKLKKIEEKSWKIKEMLFIVRNKNLFGLHF